MGLIIKGTIPRVPLFSLWFHQISSYWVEPGWYATGFFYAATDIDASWLQTESLQRVDAKELSRDDFLERFETQPRRGLKRGGLSVEGIH